MNKTLRTLGVALALGMTLPLAASGCSVETGQDALDATAASARFEIFTGEDGQYYFQLLAGNGEKMLRSEGYATRAACQGGIKSVKSHGTSASAYEILEAQNGEHYFNLVATNGEIIATGETYASKSNATRAVTTLTRLVKSAVSSELPPGSPRFDTFKGADGKTYFNLRAANGQIVLQSQGYSSKSAANNGIASVKKNGVDGTRYEILEGSDGQFYFRLKAANNQIVGRGEMYVSKYGAERGAQTVQRIVRELAGVKASDGDVQAAIEQAADGLLYMSESDYPFTYVTATLEPGAVIDEALVREKLASYVDGDPDADKPLKDLFSDGLSWAEWTEDDDQCSSEEDDYLRELCTKQAVLNRALSENLTDLQVFYFGAHGAPGSVDGIGVSIIIVGRTPSGNLAGVRTIAIWT